MTKNLKKIKEIIIEIEKEAKEKNMDIDWEAMTLKPKWYVGLTPHQRDFYIDHWKKAEYWRDFYDNEDKDPPDWDKSEIGRN